MKDWTEQEIRYMQQWYGKKPVKVIAKNLYRSYNSVQRKAQTLGLTTPNIKSTRKAWTEEELDYLERNYTKRSCTFIAKKLNRTITSIKRKANTLGLNAYIHDEVHVKTMARCFDADSRMINRWIDKFELPCKKVKRGNAEFKTIDVKTFWKWAKDHQDIIPWSKYELYSLLPQPEWLKDTIKQYNETQKNHRKRITGIERQTVMRLKNMGKSDKEIAKELNRTVESIKHIWRDGKEK